MTAQEQTAAVEGIAQQLQALKERAQEVCGYLDYKAGSRLCRALDAIEQAQRYTKYAANMTREAHRA